MVSGYIGKNKLKAVIPIIWKTARLSLLTTCLIAFPFLVLPEFFLYPLLGAEDMHLVYEAKPIFLIILGLLAMFSVATIFFNGLSGTGASFQGLNIQIVCTLIYLLCAFYIIKVREMGLVWAWASEGIYWLLILFASSAALQTEKWKGIFD
jgi:Na+-driven multidrug efflux pump